MLTKYQIEEIVLGLADIIDECRYLRRENARLREVERKRDEEIVERLRANQEIERSMLMLGLGIIDKERERNENN